MRSRILRSCVTVALLALLFGCDDDPVQVQTAGDGPQAIVTTTDYSTGALSSVDLTGSHRAHVNVASIHSDAVVRVFDDAVYVVNRYLGDNIQILDPSDGFSVVRQFSVGNGSDPHDIAVASPTRAYVPRYNETDLWIVDPSTGAHTGSIDLSALADGDGIPEMDQVLLDDGMLFVTIQRANRGQIPWSPAGDSYVAVIDVAADTLLDTDAVTPGVQPITLPAANPFSTLQRDAATGNLYVAGVGEWGLADAGVSWVSPASLAGAGMSLAGVDAGGDITDVEIVSATRGYAIVTNDLFETTLLAFDPASGAVTDTVYAPGTFSLQDAEVSAGGDLYVADRSPTAPGIRIYDAATGTEKTAAPIDVGLPPFNIAFWE
jgi:hypothetical protein